MNIQHEIKLSSFILPVVRTMPDESVIVQSGKLTGRFIPQSKKLVFTDRKGKIKSIKAR
jgi:hypothetical protein